MAKHEIIIHENTSATKESAPYLGSYLSKETIKSDEFAAKIAEKCGLPAIQVQAIIAGAFDAIEELEKEDEKVVLENDKGETVATASVSYSDLQNVKGVFEGVEIEPGEYTLCVYTRSGMGDEYGVKKATRKVTVK